MRRIVLAFALLLVLASCRGQAPEGPIAVTGTQGVVVTPLDPPSEVYENERFSLAFELENRGAHNVTEQDPGWITVEYDGLYLQDPEIVSRYRGSGNDALNRLGGGLRSTTETRTPFWLYARTPFYDGEISFLTLYLTARPIERNSAEIRTPVLLSVCYPYESSVTQQVCLEQERRPDRGAVICLNNPVTPQTPGAPIVVEQVVTRTYVLRDAPDADGIVVPQFRILLRNRGKGIPATAPCDATGSLGGALNNASVQAFLLDQPLECMPAQVHFIRGEAWTVCSVPDGSDLSINPGAGNYLSLLTVDVSYTYRESARVEVRVVR